MQFFKLLALAPMACSLVAAATIKSDAALAARNRQMESTCDTSRISSITGRLDVELDVEVTLGIYEEYCKSVESTWSTISTGVSIDAELDVTLQTIRNVQELVIVSHNTLTTINDKCSKMSWDKFDPSVRHEFAGVFAEINLWLNTYADGWSSIDASLRADIQASLMIFGGYYKEWAYSCSQSFIGIGIDVDIYSAVELTLRAFLSLDINLGVTIDGLLGIGI